MTKPTPAADAANDPAPSALDGLIQQAEANNTPDPEPIKAPPSDGLEDDLLSALKMAQAVARGGVWWLTPDEFERLWGDQTLRGIAGPGAEIMRRHGWDVAGLMSRYGPYIALAGAIAPPAIATGQAYKTATRAETRSEPTPHHVHDSANG